MLKSAWVHRCTRDVCAIYQTRLEIRIFPNKPVPGRLPMHAKRDAARSRVSDRTLRSPASSTVVVNAVVVVERARSMCRPRHHVRARGRTCACTRTCRRRRVAQWFSAHMHGARWKNVKWWLVIAVANGSPTSRTVGRLSPLHVAAPPPGAASYQGA